MVRERHRKKGGLGAKIGGLLLINIIPVCGLGWLAWAFATGRITTDDFPDGTMRQVAYAGVALILLFLVAALILPLVHAAAKGLRRSLFFSAEKRREGGALRKAWELLLWPFRTLFYVVFWILRLAAYFVSLGLIAAIVLFVVRAVQPEFLATEVPVEDWIATADRWIRDRFA